MAHRWPTFRTIRCLWEGLGSSLEATSTKSRWTVSRSRFLEPRVPAAVLAGGGKGAHDAVAGTDNARVHATRGGAVDPGELGGLVAVGAQAQQAVIPRSEQGHDLAGH